MRTLRASALLCFILLFSCTNNEKNSEVNEENDIRRMGWVLGDWQMVDGDYITLERWEKVSDKIFSGKSWTLKGMDTVFSENITLQQNGDGLYYIPQVKGQNNDQPVPFKFIGVKDGEFTFENLEHDYPQQIIYKNPQPDMLCARIAGSKEGKPHHDDFNFVRRK